MGWIGQFASPWATPPWCLSKGGRQEGGGLGWHHSSPPAGQRLARVGEEGALLCVQVVHVRVCVHGAPVTTVIWAIAHSAHL